jgi:hypothetical protein
MVMVIREKALDVVPIDRRSAVVTEVMAQWCRATKRPQSRGPHKPSQSLADAFRFVGREAPEQAIDDPSLGRLRQDASHAFPL